MTVKLYTKKGDAGKTSLFSGRRAEKFDPRVAAVGDLDELSASIGFARVGYPPASEALRAAQHALYSISAIVSAENRKIELAFKESEVAALEQIDQASDALTWPSSKDGGFTAAAMIVASTSVPRLTIQAARVELPVDLGK